MLKTKNLLLSVAIFVLVVSNMLLAGPILGVHTAPSQPNPGQKPSPVEFYQIGVRGEAASAGVVEVSALPSSSVQNGKLWSTFHSATPASQASSTGLSPSTLSTTSSSSVAFSGGFDGLNMTQSCQCIPPDPIIGAGPNHVVEMVNLEGEIFNKQGVSVQTFTLKSFFNTGTHFISDPKVLYDPISGRWFASVLDFFGDFPGSQIVRGRVDIAVSTTSDPTGAWNRYFVQPLYNTIPNPVNLIPDQPIIGVSDDKFVVSINPFANTVGTDTMVGSQYWILNKSEMLSGTTVVDFASFGPLAGFESIHPVQSMSSTTTQYLVSSGGGDVAYATNTITLFTVTGIPPGNVTAQVVSLPVSLISNPPPAAQPGGQSQVDSGDHRVMDAAWFQGKLWLSLADSCIPSGDTVQRSCVRLVQIDTTTNTVKQDFDFGTNGAYNFYPALRIDGSGNLDVLYGYSSATVFPSLAVTGQLTTDSVGSLAPSKTLKLGPAPDTSGVYGRARYGDYFGASVDPSDNSEVWVVGEYIGDATGLCFVNCWSTFIGTTSMVGYSVASNPSSLLLQAGSSATSTITITSVNGFQGTVQLSTSTPSGSSASLSASSVTLSAGGSAMVTATISNTNIISVGKLITAITGRSGSYARSAFVTTTTPDFSISPNPAALSAPVGSASTSAVSVSSTTGFQGTVSLSVTPSSGLSCTLNPTRVGISGASTLSCTASAGGTYSATVTGSSGLYSHSVTLNMSAAPFSLTASPNTIFLQEGTSGTVIINLASLAGFSGTVALSIDPPPLSGVASLSPTSLRLTSGGTNSSILTFNAPTSVPAGTFTFTVRGTAAGLSNTVQVNLGLSDFTIYASPPVVALAPNTPGTSTITVTSFNGLRGTVNLSTFIYPSTGLSCSLSSTSITLGSSGTSTLSCSTASGLYIVYVTGTLGTLSRTTGYIAFGVNDFTISTQPTTVYATAGSSASTTVNLSGSTNNVGTPSVTLSVSGLPTGTTATFSQNPVPISISYPSGSTLTISPATSTPLGTYTITVTGTLNGITHSITLTLNVLVSSYTIPQTTQTFTNETVVYSGSLTVNTASLSLTGSMSYTATNSTTGAFIDSATVSMNLPINGGVQANSAIEIPSSPYWTSVTCIFFVTQGTFDCAISRTLDINHNGAIDSTDFHAVVNSVNCSVGMSCYNPAADLLAQGTVTSIDASIESAHVGGPLFLPADFTVSSAPSTISLRTGSSGTSTIASSSLYGFTGTVNLAVSTSAGLSCTMNPTSITSAGTSTLTCNSSNPGVFTATVTGSSGPTLHATTLTVNVQQFTMSFSPSTITVANNSTGSATISVTAATTFSGNVTLTASSSTQGLSASINPNTVNLSAGGTSSTTLTVAATNVASGSYYVTVTGTSGSSTSTVTIQVTVTDFQITAPQTGSTAVGLNFNANVGISPVNGFTGSVSLSSSVSVNSITCSLTPTSISLGSTSTSNLSCLATIGGTYSIIVTGRSGAISHSASIALSVGDFTVRLGSSSLTARRLSFASTNVTITTNAQYFCCGDALTALTPAGVSVSFATQFWGNTLNFGAGGYLFASQQETDTVTIMVDSSVQPGTYTVTLSVYAGGITHNLAITLVVPSFQLTANPPSISFRQNFSASTAITVTSLNGYSGIIIFSGTVSAPGLICLLTPASVTIGTSATATLTCQGTKGSYTVTVTGSNNSMSHSVSIPVTVNP